MLIASREEGMKTTANKSVVFSWSWICGFFTMFWVMLTITLHIFGRTANEEAAFTFEESKIVAAFG